MLCNGQGCAWNNCIYLDFFDNYGSCPLLFSHGTIRGKLLRAKNIYYSRMQAKTKLELISYSCNYFNLFGCNLYSSKCFHNNKNILQFLLSPKRVHYHIHCHLYAPINNCMVRQYRPLPFRSSVFVTSSRSSGER